MNRLMCTQRSAVSLILGVLIGACSNPDTPSPSATVASTAPSVAPSASPSPVAGGCGKTPVFAGPGPDANLGLADNPWAWATPANAGIVAYFWYPPPHVLFAHGPNGRTKVLWVNHGALGGHLIIAAHPLDASAPVVHFEFPGGGGGTPSSIDLPNPGCWTLDLAIGDTRATMDVLVAPDR
jgi:hypothetical protein